MCLRLVLPCHPPCAFGHYQLKARGCTHDEDPSLNLDVATACKAREAAVANSCSFVDNSFGGHASPSVRGIPQRRSNLFLEGHAPRRPSTSAEHRRRRHQGNTSAYPPGFLALPIHSADAILRTRNGYLPADVSPPTTHNRLLARIRAVCFRGELHPGVHVGGRACHIAPDLSS
jgi:hypothetical protein